MCLWAFPELLFFVLRIGFCVFSSGFVVALVVWVGALVARGTLLVGVSAGQRMSCNALRNALLTP